MTSSRDHPRGRSHPHRLDASNEARPENKERFRGVEESYDDSHSSHSYHERDRSRHIKRRRDSESLLSSVSKSDSSDGRYWKSKSKRHKPMDVDDLTMPWMCEEAAAQVERWAMPTWCHMFNSTLIGAARVWFDELPLKSKYSYKDLNAAFLVYFMQQKKYVKDPVEIHKIKQKDEETIEDFMKRFKVETGRMKGAPECMRISGFMHGVKNPKLTKRLNEHVPKTMEEMMITTTAFIRGKVVAASKKKGHTSWRAQDQSKRQTSEKRTDFRGHPREGRGSSRFTPLTRTPKEILAAEAGKFQPPPPMVTPVEKISINKFCDFHNNKGYNMDECMQLKKHIEELVRAGKLSHLIKEIKHGRDQSKPSDITGVPRSIVEHRLNIREGYSPVRQKKRGQAPKRAKAIQAEVQKLVDAGIMREVYYHDRLSKPVVRLVDKAFDSQIGQNIEVYVNDLVVKSHTEAEMLRDIEAETDMKKATEAKNAKLVKELENLHALFADLQVRNDRLFQQETTLQAQVTGEEKLKAAFEEFKKYEDDRVKKRCAKMDARMDALSINFDDELYPNMLTVIVGRRWVIGHGLRLAVIKCGESTELRHVFTDVVSAGIAKGMNEGLKYEVEHGKANLDLEAIEAYDPEAETKYVAALHALRDLMYPIVDQLKSLKDAPIDVVMASLHLESNSGEDAPQWIRELRPSSFQLKIPVYLDSHTEAEMLRDIGETFRTLRKINMKHNRKKCTFGVVEGMFLGYMVTPKGIKPCPDKTEVVLQLPSPRTIKEVQSLNGKLASLNRFLSKSAEKSLLLFKTLKKFIKKSDFHWTLEAEQAFKQLKQHLSELPLLVAPKPKEELIVYLSASYEAISTVLMTERRTVQCHSTFQEASEVFPNASYREHNITYRPRTSVKGQVLADFLAEMLDESPQNAPAGETQQDPWTLFTDGSSCVDGSSAGLILASLEGTKFTYALRFQFTASNNEAEYEALIKRGKKVPHQGPIVRIIGRGSLQAVIPYAVVKVRRTTPSRPLTPITALWPFYKWGIDIAGFPKGSGKVKFLIVDMDYFTKLIEAKAVATITGSQVKKFVWDNIVCRFGLSGEIVSNNGKQFSDNPFEDWCDKLNITQWVRGVPFRPGDFVYRNNDASHAVDGGKLGPKWEGPYEVTEALGD
nr:reverse transcriptase domain-containing protein [Tanacetum cinerariifolium]